MYASRAPIFNACCRQVVLFFPMSRISKTCDTASGRRWRCRSSTSVRVRDAWPGPGGLSQCKIPRMKLGTPCFPSFSTIFDRQVITPWGPSGVGRWAWCCYTDFQGLQLCFRCFPWCLNTSNPGFLGWTHVRCSTPTWWCGRPAGAHALEQHAAHKGPCLYNSVDYAYSIPGYPHSSNCQQCKQCCTGKYCLLVLSSSEGYGFDFSRTRYCCYSIFLSCCLCSRGTS